MDKRQLQKDELRISLSREYPPKHPLFSPEQISQFHQLFSLFADPRQRKIKIQDLITAAKTHGFNSQYQLVFHLFQHIYHNNQEITLNFQSFLQELTVRLDCRMESSRKNIFSLLDTKDKDELDLNDLRYMNEQLKYGYNDSQLLEMIHQVGGYKANTIKWEKFNKIIERKSSFRR